jgi:cytochrome c oxidase assembly protein subunit 15
LGYRLPFVTTIAIFLLFIAGALVVEFDAGLACSDWPLCNGHIIPPMEGKIIIEYTHRMLTTGVGLLTLANLYMAWRYRKETPLAAKLAGLSFVLLIVVAVLGGINVLKKLPPGFTAMDTSVGMLLFATFVVLTGVTLLHHRRKHNQLHENKQIRSLFKPALVATIAVYVQLALGAFIKHSDAGAIWVNGKVTLLNDIISTPEIAANLVYAHVFITMAVVLTTLWLFFHGLQKKVLKGQTMVLAILLGLEVVAGVSTVITKLAVLVNVAHLALGAAMLAVSVFIMVQAKIGADLLACNHEAETMPKSNRSIVNIG